MGFESYKVRGYKGSEVIGFLGMGSEGNRVRRLQDSVVWVLKVYDSWVRVLKVRGFLGMDFEGYKVRG